MDKKDSERIYHIERKVDRILEILEKQQQGYVFPGVSKEPCHCPGQTSLGEHPFPDSMQRLGLTQ